MDNCSIGACAQELCTNSEYQQVVVTGKRKKDESKRRKEDVRSTVTSAKDIRSESTQDQQDLNSTETTSNKPIPNKKRKQSKKQMMASPLKIDDLKQTCLLAIDVQNDFIDGSLALRNCPAKQEAAEIVPVINSLRSLPFKKVVWSLDYHPSNHCSFVDNVHHHPLHEDSPVLAHQAKLGDVVIYKGPPKTEQKLWPAHCVAGTWGAELHKDLVVSKDDLFVRKGTHSAIDSYSAFYDNAKLQQTELDHLLKKEGLKELFVCGLALDYCVGSTALHAAELGYKVWLVKDASRGVCPKSIQAMERQLVEAGVDIVESVQVKALFEECVKRTQINGSTCSEDPHKQQQETEKKEKQIEKDKEQDKDKHKAKGKEKETEKEKENEGKNFPGEAKGLEGGKKTQVSPQWMAQDSPKGKAKAKANKAKRKGKGKAKGKAKASSKKVHEGTSASRFVSTDQIFDSNQLQKK